MHDIWGSLYFIVAVGRSVAYRNAREVSSLADCQEISAAIGSYADGKRVAKVSDVERNFRTARHKDVSR
jgi:hypothetical protein